MQDVSGTQAQQVVRGLPRSRGLLQRPLRQADQGTDRYAGSADRPGLHVVPRHRARGQHAWATATSPWSIRRCTNWPPARIKYIRAHRLLPHLPESRSRTRRTFMKPFMREQSAEYLLDLPQGASGCAGEQLPLGARLQRLRQLAGERRLGTGRAIVLLSAEDLDLRGLPHAAGRIAGSGQSAMARSIRIAFPRRIRRCAHVNQDAAQLNADREVSEVRLHHGGHLRRDAGRRPPGPDHHETAQRKRVQAMSTFAVGEEAEQNAPGGDPRSRQGRGADRACRAAR